MAGPSKTIYWDIGKALQSVRVNPSSVSIGSGDTATVTASGASGTLSASSSNAAVATARISGSSVIITGVGDGSAVITVTASESALYDSGFATINVSVRGSVSIPTQSGTLRYTGAAQSPTWSGYDATKMTLGGTTSGINAGTYNALFTLKSGYAWSDGTTTAKSVSWSIGKAEQNMVLSPNSVMIGASESITISVTRSGNGAITATSADSSVATASVSGYNVSVRGVQSGNTSVTVSVAETQNYQAGQRTAQVVVAAGSATATCSIENAGRAGGIEVIYSDGETGSYAYKTTIGYNSSTTITVPTNGMIVIRSLAVDLNSPYLNAITGSIISNGSWSDGGAPIRAYIVKKGGSFRWQ